jgi:predicted phage tail protein
MALRDIHLHGKLGRKYGRKFRLDVSSHAQAFRALALQLPGFENDLKNGAYRVIRGDLETGLPLKHNELEIGLGREMHIVPTPIAAGLETIVIIGLTLIAAVGLSLALMPTIEAPNPNEREGSAQTNSGVFDGPVNVTEQNHPVPLVFGMVRIGSVVGAASIDTSEASPTYVGGSGGQGTGGFFGDPAGVFSVLAKGGKGGGSSRSASEVPNSLQSQATARILDMVSEGEIDGLVDGLKSVYLDDTPVQNADDSFNFQGFALEERVGLPDQASVLGFSSVETTSAVDTEITILSGPVEETITTSTADRVRVTLGLQSFYSQNTENGDIDDAQATVAIDIAESGGSFSEVGQVAFDGKTNDQYQRSVTFDLPYGGNPWTIRARRITADSEVASLQNATYFDLITEITDVKLIYPDTAYYAVTVDAKQFGSNIPTRSYLIKGMKLLVPTNYDPVAKTYSGVWNGTFKTAWTDNPAWIFYNILVNKRWGLGNRIVAANVDKYGLYVIGQYCDASVSDGNGGTEPRFSCNTVINTRWQALDLLSALAASFRSMVYWSAGSVMLSQDAPATVSRIVTPSNIVDGKFDYSNGNAYEDQFSAVLVSWTDPTEGYRLNTEVVEDPELVRTLGWRPVEITAFGCTSQSQANRVGRWALEDQTTAGSLVKYIAGFDHADLEPGRVVATSDPRYTTSQMGGRVKAGASTTVIPLDREVILSGGETYTLMVMQSDGTVAERVVSTGAGTVTSLTVGSGFAESASAGAVWALKSTSIAPREWRIRASKDVEDGEFEMTGVMHDSTKYARVEDGVSLEPLVFTDLPTGPIAPPTAIGVREYLKTEGDSAVPSLSISVRPPITDGRVTSFQVQHKKPNTDNWDPLRSGPEITREVVNVAPGAHEFRARSLDNAGRFSSWVGKSFTITAETSAMPEVVSPQVVTENDGLQTYLIWGKPDDTRPLRYEVFFHASSVDVADAASRGVQTAEVFTVPETGNYWVKSAFMAQRSTTPVRVPVITADLPVVQRTSIASDVVAEVEAATADVAALLTTYGSTAAAAVSAATALGAQTAAESAQAAAEAAFASSTTAQTAAEAAQTAAETAETNAQTHATSASGSATAASGYADNASASETAAGSSASAAAASAVSASSSYDSADAAATAAAGSASAASTSASAAATSASASSTSATASEVSRLAAEAAQTGAAGSAAAASTSASNAVTAQTGAETAQSAAATSASAAATSETNASNSASAASTSASTAATSASAAGTSASASATSAVTADTHRSESVRVLREQSMLYAPDRHSRNLDGAPSTLGDVPDINYDEASATVTLALNEAQISIKEAFKPIEGRTYRATVTWKYTGTAPATDNRIGFRRMDASYVYVSNVWSSALNIPAVDTWTTETYERTADATDAAGWFRTFFWFSSSGGARPAGRVISHLYWEDITESEAAAASASASASSASAASASETAAGASATSATGSANTAATEAGNASGSASAAASSASAASSSSTDAENAAAAAAATQLTAEAFHRRTGPESRLGDFPTHWTSNGSTGPDDTSDLNGSIVADATEGNVNSRSITAGLVAYYLLKAPVAPYIEGRVIRITTRIKCSSDNGAGTFPVSAGIAPCDEDGIYDSGTMSTNVQLTTIETNITSGEGWQTLSCDVTLNAPTSASRYWRPRVQADNSGGGSTGGIYIAWVSWLDVTDSVAAENSASAAVTSASTASTAASDAAGYASAASSSATTASTQAGIATTQAGAASTSASAAGTSASLAATYTSISAQLFSGPNSLNNGIFEDWTSTLPDNWANYGSNTNTKVTSGSIYGTNAMNMVNTGVNGGLYQTYNSSGSIPEDTTKVFIELELVLNSGAWGQAGILLRKGRVDAGSGSDVRFAFADYVPTPILGNLYKIGGVFDIDTPTPPADFDGTIQLYIMSNWTGISGTATANNFTVHRIIVRAIDANEANLEEVREAMVSSDGSLARFRRTTQAGISASFFEMSALESDGTTDSEIGLGARRIALYSEVDGDYALAMEVVGTDTKFYGSLTAGAGIFVGDGNVKWPVALEPQDYSVADGDVTSFGLDFGVTPDFSFSTIGLDPLATGEVYQLRAISASGTGFTSELKIITPGTTSSVTQSTNATTPTGPSQMVAKAETAVAYNDIYNFRIDGTVIITEHGPSGEEEYTGTINVQTYFHDGTSWVAGPSKTIDWQALDVMPTHSSGASSYSFSNIVFAVTYTGTIRSSASLGCFGVSLGTGAGTVTELDQVQFTKQTSSGSRSASPGGEVCVVTVKPKNAIGV